MSKNVLREAIQRSLYVSGMAGAAVALGSLALPAAAQNAPAPQSNNQQPQTLQTIVVTGSHIRRVDLETDNPVVAVSAQQIAATGALTLGDVVDKLPAITGGLETTTVNNGGGSGQTLIGLRGLGASRTLILVDGQRVLNKNLNAIPTAAVERVEVLTSGASAIYGSDAIGGVVNFVLKSNYQGAQFSANYGISDQGDAERKGASFIFGQTSDKGSIIAGVSYQQFDSILQSARSFSKNALTISSVVNGKPVFGIAGSSNALRGHINVGTALSTEFGCPSGGLLSLNQSTYDAGTSPTGPGDYHCYSTHADSYNFAAVNLLMTPQQRTNAFFKGVYHLSDDVDFYATWYHSKNASSFQLAPSLINTNTGLAISSESYYNPFGVTFSRSGATDAIRLLPSGNRRNDFGNNSDEIQTGFRGNVNIFDQNWQWNIGLDYGHNSFTEIFGGLPNTGEILPGLGPSFLNADGVVQCGTPSSPISLSTCTPWDPFNLNSASAKQVLKAAAAPSLENSWSIERIEHADINGGLFNLPAGTVQLAAGVSHRSEYTNNAVGPLLLLSPETLTCTLGSQCTGHTQGGYTVNEAYAELFIPILKDLPFAQGLNMTLSERYSKYSNFGSTSNWKIGMEWRPISDLLVRGTVARVFRAPTIGDLFSAPLSSAPFLSTDPCNFSGAGPNPNAGNPACKGVPATGPFSNNNITGHTQITAVNESAAFSGFPLGPEKGKSYDFGVVYSPHFVPGLSLSVDAWRIYLNNTITLVGVQSVMNLCFAGQTIWCDFINRVQSGPSSGQIATMIQPIANLGRLDVKGTDFSAAYRLPDFSFGQFTVNLNATYLDQFKSQTAPGVVGNTVNNGAGLMGWFGSDLQSVCASFGGLCFFPRVKAQAMLDWQLGPWNAQWTLRYNSRFTMAPGLPAVVGVDTTGVVGIGQYGSSTYSDLMVGYDIQPINTTVNFGVNNVMDRQPPILGQGISLNANTDPADFDTIGRYYWARVTVKF